MTPATINNPTSAVSPVDGVQSGITVEVASPVMTPLLYRVVELSLGMDSICTIARAVPRIVMVDNRNEPHQWSSAGETTETASSTGTIE